MAAFFMNVILFKDFYIIYEGFSLSSNFLLFFLLHFFAFVFYFDLDMHSINVGSLEVRSSLNTQQSLFRRLARTKTGDYLYISLKFKNYFKISLNQKIWCYSMKI